MKHKIQKNETKKLIDITPHKSLLLKVGQTGYNLQEAISELVDNSIDARFPNKKINIDLKVSSDVIQISDDGIGMNEETAAKSIRLGFSNKKGQLGEFGLGLKTASTFLGHHFTIVTSQKESTDEFVVTYDEDEWMTDGDWNKYPFTIRHGREKSFSGTTVIIEKLKIDINQNILERLQQELSVRFGPFIKNKILNLTINGKLAEAFEPKIIGKRNKINLKVGKQAITGWWGYQLRGLNRDYFGFNTFRRGRLVTTYDKIGLNPNQEIKQIIGELEISGVPISHDKKNWQKGTSSYKAVYEALRKYFVDKEPRLKKILSGFCASAGIVEGVARQVNMFSHGIKHMEQEIAKVNKGDIIVTAMTRPHFLLAIRRAGAIVTDLGGNLCHAAIVAREFNIPAVVGTQSATSVIQDGQRIIVDGNDGIIYEA
jgi:pyruvate,water dikinase